jgi:hypothetical protein
MIIGLGDTDYNALYQRVRDAAAAKTARVLGQLKGSIPNWQYADVMEEQAFDAQGAAATAADTTILNDRQKKEFAELAVTIASYAQSARILANRNPNGMGTRTTAYHLIERFRNALHTASGMGITAHKEIHQFVADVKNLPAQMVEEAVNLVMSVPKGLEKGLSLPKWVIPVVAVGAGLLIVGPYVAPLIARAVSGARRAYAG